VIRVVYARQGDRYRVITLFFDRGPETMKTHYDPEADALYVRFAEDKVVESEEVRPGVVLDFDAEGRIVAMEVLDASEHLARGADLKALSAA
jgi:uncharacterized protein YuzE